MSNVIKMRHSVDFFNAAHEMLKGDLGGFAQSLAMTWFKADPTNREKIQATWPDLFTHAFDLFELKDRRQS